MEQTQTALLVNRVSLANVAAAAAATFENLTTFENTLKNTLPNFPENAEFTLDDLRHVIHILNSDVNRLLESALLGGE